MSSNVWSIVIDSQRFLICPMKHAAILMSMDGGHKSVPLEDEVRSSL